jgi:uncharacterized protein (TIGR03435 family)
MVEKTSLVKNFPWVKPGATMFLLIWMRPAECKAWQAVPTGKLDGYDTVSIRQNKSATLNSGFHPTANGISMTNVRVEQFLLLAFGIDPQLIMGLPAWAHSTRFDLAAKLDDDSFAALQKLPRTEATEDRKLMMQQILFSRFALKIHHETKEISAYALVEAKGGPKLKPVDPNLLKNPGPGYHPGRVTVLYGELSGDAITLDRLARSLSGSVDRQVVDKTGLTEKYDIRLKWLPDQASLNHQDNGLVGSRASIFTAIQEQLGLRLEPTRAEFDTIVVDHIEMPTDN